MIKIRSLQNVRISENKWQWRVHFYLNDKHNFKDFRTEDKALDFIHNAEALEKQIKAFIKLNKLDFK